ncbi:oxidoreductase superfamily protein [Perilla frutescens var. hirtella]|uniref:Oxidoreductase superfamily protein n=1 Tax=Perilla frutescens var. hirtella TaxID=608512 RepID=A0AAD4ITV0_PERFH|nr:oxidoreductase superfamily protein [Perilla frutescens var. hirtella]
MAGAGAAIPSVKLSGCEKAMPVMGMGTALFPPVGLEATKAAVLEAIKAGYRHFDTAFVYGTEQALGEAVVEAVRLSLVDSRDDLFITTKLWISFSEPSQIVPACKMSLQNLGLEYVDLYLIHYPVRLTEMMTKIPVPAEIVKHLDMKGAWEAMEECKNLGLTKAIGVSNFSCKMIQQLLSTAKILPALNQVEMNPLWQQKKLRDFCMEKGIHVTAYSPLGANNTMWGDNRIVENHVIADIAKARGKTIAQVALRWAYEQGVSLACKSFNKERMRENLQIFDWTLSDQDLEKISQLPQAKGMTLASILGPHDIVLEIDAEV